MSQGKRRGLSWRKVLLSVTAAVLTLILVAMVFVTAYWKQKLGLINYVDPDSHATLSSEQLQSILEQTDPVDPEYTGPVLDHEDVDWGDETPVLITGGEETLHILLIGQDRREGEGRQRSDAMILVSINKSKKTVTLTSFLRDMYVQIPGYKANKINASYALGGMKLLDATLEKNFGVQVDGNVEVDFGGFMEIIDLIGGVEIALTEEEASFLNRSGNWDVSGSKGWKLKEGVNQLTGEQALAYSRIRYIGMDFERSERQRKVLTAVFEKVKGMNLLELNSLLDQILPLITTDLSGSRITGYLMEYAPMLLDLKIVTQRIPVDGSWDFAWVAGYDAIVVDFDKNRDFLAGTIE